MNYKTDILKVEKLTKYFGGLAAAAGIVTDGYSGLHLVLLKAKRPETDGRPQGACKMLITLS